jgi:hypothetical protein
MKKHSFHLLSIFALLLIAGGTVCAQDAGRAGIADITPSPRHDDWLSVPECATVARACKEVGFHDGGSKNGEGLFLQCFEPLVNSKGPAVYHGHPVSVPVSHSTAMACHTGIHRNKGY